MSKNLQIFEKLVKKLETVVKFIIKYIDKIIPSKISSLILGVFIILAVIFGITRMEYAVYIFSIVLLVGYPILLHYVYNALATIKEEEVVTIVLLYLIVAMNIIIFFGLIVDGYDLLILSSNQEATVGMFESFYWASTTFTTLGYGDYVPVNNAGKFLSMVLSITGTIHMVSFLAILLNKLNKSNK